jgi:TolA-binding protein
VDGETSARHVRADLERRPIPADVDAPLVRPATTSASIQPAPPSAESPRLTLGLGAQVAALDQALEALASGDAPRAVRLVDEYQARYPSGVLSQEATALKIEALVKEGDRSAAADLARRFLASNPTSPHAVKIRLFLERGSNL